MLYLTTEHVFENFGVRAISRLTSPLVARLCVT